MNIPGLMLLIIGVYINTRDTSCPPVAGTDVAIVVLMGFILITIGITALLPVRMRWWLHIILTVLIMVVIIIASIVITVATQPGGLLRCWQY
jgi:hypothetical protein